MISSGSHSPIIKWNGCVQSFVQLDLPTTSKLDHALPVLSPARQVKRRHNHTTVIEHRGNRSVESTLINRQPLFIWITQHIADITPSLHFACS